MKVKYKLKFLIPIVTMLGGALSTSCGKGNSDPEKPHHNTTYIWGFDNFTNIQPASRVAASADSILVDKVFLENDGASLHGVAPGVILQQFINPVIEATKPENRHKIYGKGTLNEMGMNSDPKIKQDSIKLAQMGFKFGKIRY